MKLSAAHRQAQATALIAAIGINAILETYSGAAPATVDTAVTGTLLVTHTGNAAQFGTAAGGVITVSAVANANAVGGAATAPGYMRIKTSGGTAVADFVYSTDITASPAAITAGQTIVFSSLTITMGGA